MHSHSIEFNMIYDFWEVFCSCVTPGPWCLSSMDTDADLYLEGDFHERAEC